MSILSGEKIKEALESGLIKVTPHELSSVGPASIDLSLGREFRTFEKGNGFVNVTEETNYKEHTNKTVLKDGESFILEPGTLCLAQTEEIITLDESICGLLEGRTRFARMGLFIHVSCGLISPGVNNRQVLEIFNASNRKLALIPGTKVCQLVFVRMDGKAKYTGKFSENIL